MAEPISTAIIALKAGEEVAGAVREYIKKRPTEAQKALKEFFKLLREKEKEIKKPLGERDHDKIMELWDIERLFTNTVLKGVESV